MSNKVKFDDTVNLINFDPRMDYIVLGNVDDKEFNTTCPTSNPYHKGIHVI